MFRFVRGKKYNHKCVQRVRHIIGLPMCDVVIYWASVARISRIKEGDDGQREKDAAFPTVAFLRATNLQM